jgi:isocitrate lyase
MGVSTLVVAHTDAESARLITSDVDARDLPFIEQDSRTVEGFFRLNGALGCSIAQHALCGFAPPTGEQKQQNAVTLVLYCCARFPFHRSMSTLRD